MEVKKVVDEGFDVMETAMYILLGNLAGEFVLKHIMPAEFRQYAPYVMFLGGIVAGAVIRNRVLSPVFYGMSVSGALDILSPYVSQLTAVVQ